MMHDIDKNNNEGVARDCQGESREILAVYVATDIICRCGPLVRPALHRCTGSDCLSQCPFVPFNNTKQDARSTGLRHRMNLLDTWKSVRPIVN